MIIFTGIGHCHEICSKLIIKIVPLSITLSTDFTHCSGDSVALCVCVCVCVFVLFSYKGVRTPALSSPCKTNQADFTGCMSALPSNPKEEIHSNIEALRTNTESFSSTWKSWKDNNLSINALIQPITHQLILKISTLNSSIEKVYADCGHSKFPYKTDQQQQSKAINTLIQ